MANLCDSGKSIVVVRGYTHIDWHYRFKVENVKSAEASLQSSTVIMPGAEFTSESLHLPTPPRDKYPDVSSPPFACATLSLMTESSIPKETPANSSAAESQVPFVPASHAATEEEEEDDEDKDSIISFSESAASSFFDVDQVTTTTESHAGEVEGGSRFRICR